MSISGSIVGGVSDTVRLVIAVVKWALVVIGFFAAFWFIKKLAGDIKQVKEERKALKDHEEYLATIEKEGEHD